MKENKNFSFFYCYLTVFLLIEISSCVDDCSENAQHIFIKEVNEKTCKGWQYPRYLLSGETYTFRCISSLNERLESAVLNLTDQMPEFQPIKRNDNLNELTIYVNSTNDKRNNRLYCNYKGEIISIQLIICSRLRSPLVEVIAEPIAPTSIHSKPHLDVTLWLSTKKPNRDCYVYFYVRYKILGQGTTTTELKSIENTTDSSIYTVKFYPISITFDQSSHDFPTLEFYINSTVETELRGRLEERQSFASVDVEQHYRQPFTPIIESCEATYCPVKILVPSLTEFCMNNTTFEITISVNGSTSKTYTRDITIRTSCAMDNGFLHHNISDLIPDRFYNFTISYRLKSSRFFSGPYYLQNRTKAKKPETIVNCPPGAYYITDGVVSLLCKTVSQVNGPYFQYHLYSQDGTFLSFSTVARFVVNRTDIPQNFLVTCRNAKGKCPANTTIKIATSLKNVVNFVVEYKKETKNVVITWSKATEAISYTVCWCPVQDWSLCNKDLDCETLPRNNTQWSSVMRNSSDFVFGVSACYESGCSQMTIADYNSRHIANISHPVLWFGFVLVIILSSILIIVGIAVVSDRIDKNNRRIIQRFEILIEQTANSEHLRRMEAKRRTNENAEKWFINVFGKSWKSCADELALHGRSEFEHPSFIIERNSPSNNSGTSRDFVTNASSNNPGTSRESVPRDHANIVPVTSSPGNSRESPSKDYALVYKPSFTSRKPYNTPSTIPKGKGTSAAESEPLTVKSYATNDEDEDENSKSES